MKTTRKRDSKILHEVLHHESVSIEDLVTSLGVSAASVRRDLTKLERKGLVRRTHGGALTIEPMIYEPFRYDAVFRQQEQRYGKEKRRIGLAAAEMVRHGETVILTAGTTTTQIARSLRHRENIKVVTNAVNIAMELSGRREIKVYVTGGLLQFGWFSLIGQSAVESVSNFYADRIFMGACGVHPRLGVTVLETDEATTFRAMIDKSKKRVVVADSSKLGVATAAVVCPISEIQILITDARASDEMIAPFVAAGVEVRRV
jgi:DeoR family transcriptional regulator, aga operon transcriptional repressor